MSYAGFGIQSMSSFRKPRQAFKPIFEQLAHGEHPTKVLNDNFSSRWKEIRTDSRLREMKAKILTNYVYLFIIIGMLSSLLIASL